MSKTRELEKDIQALNFLLLEQKDQINALAADRDKWKRLVEMLAKKCGLSKVSEALPPHDPEKCGCENPC